MRNFTITLLFVLYSISNAWAQFTSVQSIKPVSISTDTKEKPQSKVWMHDGKYWTVLTNGAGTHVWRLDGDAWTNVLTLSTTVYGRADCKVVGNVVHIFLFRESTSYLFSIEYVPDQNNYQLWSERTSRIPLTLPAGAETATIDIDTEGRMWLATDSDSSIAVFWSDPPYASWSTPITIASGILADDIGAVIALPMLHKIGVFWSNQNTKRFGFKLHPDGTKPELWSTDEVPSSQSAINVNGGMADDHMNMALGRDGTLYCAVKTSYDEAGYPRIALLVRRPSGKWDNLYGISEIGTRATAILNEDIGKLRVIYSQNEDGGDILYKETSTSRIKFGPQHTLIKGKYNHSTSIKDHNSSEVVILASDSMKAVGVLATDGAGQDPEPELEASPIPFHENTNIDFSVPAHCGYSVSLYNLAGSLIDVLVEGYAAAEEKHSINLNATQIPLGLYFVRLQTEKGNRTLKIIRN